MDDEETLDSRFVRWASIEGLHHVRRNLAKEVDKQGRLLPPFNALPRSGVVTYKAKIKLHGVNSAISFVHGTMRIQSRNTYLDEGGKGKGGFGFAKWAEDNRSYFEKLFGQARKHHLLAGLNDSDVFAVFGEWAGPGVQKHVALSKLPQPIFCVFSLRVGANLVVEPDDIVALLTHGNISLPSHMYVLPWHRDQRLDGSFVLDLHYYDEEQLQRRAELVNTMIQEIDREDPWVRESFGVVGTGEGLVWYPVSFCLHNRLLPDELFTAFSFKTKGTSHQMVVQKIAGVQLTTEIAANPSDFATMFCTEPRFNQGAVEVCQGVLQAPLRDKFIAWVLADIKKEGSIELTDSKLTWSSVEPLIKQKAATWFDAELLKEGNEKGELKGGQLFDGLNFAFADRVSFKEKSDLTQVIKKHGGNVIFMLPQKGGFYMIATADEVKANSYKIEQALKKPDVVIISSQFVTDSAAQGRLVSIARYTLASATPPPAAAAAAAISSSFLSSYSSSSASSPEPPPHNDSNINSGKRVTATVYTHGSNTEPSFASSFKVLKWDVLHLMDMSANSNKYYSIEMHEAESGASLYRFRIFTHHGRTDEIETSGRPGTRECRYMETKQEATALYDQILAEKLDPEKGYHKVLLQSVSSKIGSGQVTQRDAKEEGKSESGAGASSLPPLVQNLVSFLFQQASDALTAVLLAKVTKQGIETPLGLVSSAQIAKGDDVLQRLCKAVSSGNSEEIVKLNSEFYSLIPHKLGKRKEEVHKHAIASAAALEEKQNLLQLMRDLVTLSERDGQQLAIKSEIDRKYLSLGCTLTPLEPSSAKYREIQSLVIDSKPQLAEDFTANRLVVKNIFAMKREQEFQEFAAKSAWISNNRLLFHASRVSNFVGLLSRGLLLPKIVLKEGLSTRTDFGFLGAGIYFSDNLYASVKYTSFKDNPQATPASRYALLANVALGNMKDYMQIDSSLESPPDGYQSCHAIAATPNMNTDFKNDEYVVYSASQVRLDYLVEFSLTK